MVRKLSIKPVHLVLIGLATIALGVLIPSFFINPFSTIGLSIIIGSAILLLAYVFFAVNLVKSKGKKTIKWLAIPLILALLVGGGLLINYRYQQSLADKIYSVGEEVKMDGFTFRISSTTVDDIPMNLQGIDLASRKDCSALAKDSQAYHDCDWYNWPRRNAQNYLNDYYRATAYYEVKANDTVTAEDLTIQIMPASGREIRMVNSNARSSDDTFSFLWQLGEELNGDYRSLEYQSSPRSDFGGDVLRGISREGWISADLKKSEKIYDIVVSYKSETRIIRIAP